VCVCVCRHGKIQSVRLIAAPSDARTCSSSSSAVGGGAVVAFMDIRCASRAHDSVNVLDGSTLITTYNESSTTPAPVVSVPASTAPHAVTSATETTPTRDARRHAAADRRSPGLNGGKCHRRADGYVTSILMPLKRCLHYHTCTPYMYGRDLILLWPRPVFRGCHGGQTRSVGCCIH